MADEPDGHGAASPPALQSDLSPSERRDRIAEYVLGREWAAARDLATMFDVSLMTIHRDLDELERLGVLRKMRGGATPQPSSLFESNVRYRLGTARAEKEAVARRALHLIEPGQAVLLDDASTTLALARLLPAVAPLTVITNFRHAMDALYGVPGIRLIALGGEYFPHHDSFMGLICEGALATIRADVFFMSTSAVSSGVAWHQEPVTVSAKRAMLQAASKRVLLIDHGKLGKVALHQLAPLSAFDLVIVDSGIDERGREALREAHVRFEVAPMENAQEDAT
ncbi:MAG TPA: DeoR/GlpR family DNA-binding transcription regulator [Thermomicrobiales bacterium]|nr:DeoR/GlpR family DNA-binding transcription regulator [Thermomicrobiales bacterium]